jgi:ADP-glucose pyrophosphorylase
VLKRYLESESHSKTPPQYFASLLTTVTTAHNIPVHHMKRYWEVEEKLYSFLTSSLDGVEPSASRHGRFTPGKRAAGIQ